MARIENTTDRQYDIYALPKDLKDGKAPVVATKAFAIPRVTTDEKNVRHNGVGEIPDAVLDELLAKDDWTKAIFASGELVRIAGPSDEPKKK